MFTSKLCYILPRCIPLVGIAPSSMVVHVSEKKEGRGGQRNWLVTWDQLIGNQSEDTPEKHFAAEVLHKGLHLKVEIAQQFIRASPPQQLDMTAVNIST